MRLIIQPTYDEVRAGPALLLLFLSTLLFCCFAFPHRAITFLLSFFSFSGSLDSIQENSSAVLGGLYLVVSCSLDSMQENSSAVLGGLYLVVSCSLVRLNSRE